MKRVYSHPSLPHVHLVKNELENHGIDAVVRGEHAAAVLGGASGIDAWNELWVLDEAQAREAASIIERVVGDATLDEGAPWTCPACGERIETPFQVCWNCGAERPAAAG